MTRCFVAFLSAIVTTACGAVEEPQTEDVEAAEQASTSTETSTDVAYVSAYFAASPTLGNVPLATAPEQAIAQVMATIEADLEQPECVTVDTDYLTYLEITFDECRGARGRLLIDGSIRGELDFEAVPCGPAQCPVALIYDIATSDLVVGGASVAGAWQVRDPLATGEASTWEGQTEIVGPGGRTVSMSSSASWLTDGECTTMSLNAEIERAVGTTSVTTTGVTRCVDQCPQAGSVAISFALGSTLSWSYDGDTTATVTGPRGQVFEVTLLCAY